MKRRYGGGGGNSRLTPPPCRGSFGNALLIWFRYGPQYKFLYNAQHRPEYRVEYDFFHEASHSCCMIHMSSRSCARMLHQAPLCWNHIGVVFFKAAVSVAKSYPNRIQIVFEVYAWRIGEFPRCIHLRIAPCILDGIQFVSIMYWKCIRIYTHIPETYRYCMQPHKRNSGAFPAFHRLGKSWAYGMCIRSLFLCS